MFCSPDDTVSLDWLRLQSHLRGLGHDLDLGVPPRQFAGGLGNLNFLIDFDGRPCVLRRPPFGEIPRGANDMAREHRVLSRLWEAYPLAPRSLLYSADVAVLGAHFLVMDYRPGEVIGGTLAAGLDSRQVGPALSAMLVRLLVSLHAVDPVPIGLADLGRPEGFLQRACDGWAHRAHQASDASNGPLVTELVSWLKMRLVPGGAPTLLHCDFKLDNIVLDPRTLAPTAVLDWDMATRGDPLFDLATLLSYWTEAGDPASMQALGQMPTAQPGFWTRGQVLSAYAAQTGRDVSNFLFYRVLALFKLAVVFLQLGARHRAGTTADERYARLSALGHDILDFTHEVAHGRAH